MLVVAAAEALELEIEFLEVELVLAFAELLDLGAAVEDALLEEVAAVLVVAGTAEDELAAETLFLFPNPIRCLS